MPADIAKWLQSLGLGEYAPRFEENAIDDEVLDDLTESDLEKIGVKLGHRKKILKAIAARSKPPEPVPAAGAPAFSTPKARESLAAWERHPGERRPVTMLFADIAGSTALTERLDAEDTHDLVYGAIQRMCEAVESNRGTVCRFMGDGVMAMFGAPVASEHHAVEACEAALDMQQAVRAYAAEVGAGNAGGLRIRVGLHSGEVVVLTVGEGDKVEYDASGPTVPIAARLEQVAAPGKICISNATRSLAAHRIDTLALDPVSVKGISEPLALFELRRVRSLEEARLDSAGTPFVGRRAEHMQLRSALQACIEEGHGRTVHIRGEPGIGKTRLTEEFARAAAAAGAAIHRGLVLPFGVRKGQDAIRSLVGSLIDIAPGSAGDERERAAREAIGAGHVDAGQAVFLNDLLDLPQSTEQRALYDAMDNATRNEGKRRVACALLAAASRDRPVLVVVEDIHWADANTLAHLSALARTVAEHPALLLMTSRIEGDPLDRQWLSAIGGSPFSTIELGPLRREDSLALMRGLVESSEELIESCLERASGNPLFLEQLMRNAREGTSEALPDSIQSLVLARVDRLSADDKRALQAASVIGQRFDADVVSYLMQAKDYDCAELVDHNLVRTEGRGFLFTHALIQESVYGSLVKSQRRELHRKAAQWYAEVDLALYAEHLGHAGDETAPAAFLDAAREQAGQYRIEKALSLVERGLDLAAQAERFPLLQMRGELLRVLGRIGESIDTYREAGTLASSDIDRCRASLGVAEGLRITESHDELIDELRTAESIASRYDLPLEMARINQLRSGVHFLRGETDACIEANELALRYAEEAASLEVQARSLSGLGDAEYMRGRMITAHRYYDKCIEISREQGYGRSLAENLMMRGAVLRWQNQPQAALRDFRESLALAEETGQLRAELIALHAGESLADWGELDESERWLERGLALSRRLGARAFEAQALAELARLAFLRGRLDEADEHARASISVLRHGGMAFCGAQAFAVLALVTRDPVQRRAALSEGEALLRGHSVSHNFLLFHIRAIEACLRTGEWDEVDRYAAAIEEYTRAEPLPYCDFVIARARALARFGRGERDEATMQALQRLLDEASRVGSESAKPALRDALASS